MSEQKNTLRFDAIVVVLTLLVSGYIIYSRIMFFSGFKNISSDKNGAAIYEKTSLAKNAMTPPSEKEKLQKIAEPQGAPKQTQKVQIRNISFTCRSPKAKKVSIAGDFNDWVPDDLKRDKRGVWRISLKLTPGHYAYNFIIDGKPYKDAYNTKTIDTGRGFISSYIEVVPLEKNAN